MKKIILFVMMFAFIFGLAACNREIDEELDSPQNVTITEGIVSWDAVEDADHYIVFVNQDENEVQTTSFDLNNLSLSIGTYAVTVVAVKDEKLSLPSTALSYVVAEEVETIDAPTSVTLANKVLSWSAVTDATGYVVHVGGMTFDVLTTALDLSLQSIPVGTHTVYVVAVKGSITSNASQTVTYIVDLNQTQDAIKSSVLSMMNETYEVGMDQEDFTDIGDYHDYLRAIESANAYAAATIELGMGQIEAIAMFTDMKDMVDGLEDQGTTLTLSQFMTELEIMDDYDMDAEAFAIIIYHLLDVMIESELRSIDLIIDDNELYLENHETYKDNLLLNTNYIEAHTFMKSFAETTAEEEAVDRLFLGYDHALYEATLNIRDMLEGGDEVSGADYLMDGEGISDAVDELIIVMTAMSNDVDGQSFIDSLEYELFELNSLIYQNEEIEYLEEDINDLEDEIVMLTTLQTSIVTQKEDMIDALEVFFDFIMTVKNNIPQSLIDDIDDALTSEALSLTEAFIIKDEIILIIQNALPTNQEFELVYETFITLAGSATQTDVTDILDYSSLMALTHRAVLDLSLTMMADIDKALIDGAMEIISDGEVIFGDITVDAQIDLMLYIYDYLDTFASENQLKITALETLYTDTIKEDIYISIIDLIQTQITNDDDMLLAEKTIILDALDDMKLEFDTYQDLYTLIDTYGSAVFTYIIDTEAELIKTITELQQMTDPALSDITTHINLVFTHLNQVSIEGLADMTAADLDIIFDAIYIPFKTTLAIEQPDVPFDDLYTALRPHIKTVILNGISLELDLMGNADLIDVSTYINNVNISSEEIGLAYAMVLALDQTLTTENQTLIDTTIDIIFDSIIKNADVLVLTDTTATEVDTMKANVESMIDSQITEIQALADLDIDTLTVDDENRLLDIYYQIFGDEETLPTT